MTIKSTLTTDYFLVPLGAPREFRVTSTWEREWSLIFRPSKEVGFKPSRIWCSILTLVWHFSIWFASAIVRKKSSAWFLFNKPMKSITLNITDANMVWNGLTDVVSCQLFSCKYCSGSIVNVEINRKTPNQIRLMYVIMNVTLYTQCNKDITLKPTT